MCRLSWNPGDSASWNPQGLSRRVMRLLYLLLTASSRQQYQDPSHLYKSTNKCLHLNHFFFYNTSVVYISDWLIWYYAVLHCFDGRLRTETCRDIRVTLQYKYLRNKFGHFVWCHKYVTSNARHEQYTVSRKITVPVTRPAGTRLVQKFLASPTYDPLFSLVCGYNRRGVIEFTPVDS
jgi:hypothetical protein